MYKKHSLLLTAILICSMDVSLARAPWQPDAKDDTNSIIVDLREIIVPLDGDVASNDLDGDRYTLTSSRVGKYGYIDFFVGGLYTYYLYPHINNDSLPSEGVATDSFEYTLGNELGFTDKAWLTIEIKPYPGPYPCTGTVTDPCTGQEIPLQPEAEDDYNTTIIGALTSTSGNVGSNDLNGNTFTLNGSRAGQYGMITSFNSGGNYTYELYNSTTNASLPSDGVGIDRFEYTLGDELGFTDSAWLTIDVNSDPDPEIVPPSDDSYENVDVEFNNRSAQSTSLNSDRNIKGHLYDSGDKDWYSLASAGDEIITLEVCPNGTSCFGKKSWVLYVFDSDRFTSEMEYQNIQLHRWVDETGTTQDLYGNEIISDDAGRSNHMYLAYEAGVFEGALIGIVDLSIDTSNTVDIGVGQGAKNYLFAISSPLKRDTNGSVFLEEPGRSASGTDETGDERKTYTTTQQFITAFPYSDDQYAIKITGTGINPLLSDNARVMSTTFNPELGKIEIPAVRVENRVYKATLELEGKETGSSDNSFNFNFADVDELSVEEVVDAYRATYNPANQQVMIPRVTDTSSGIGYSVVLQFHADSEGTKTWFEVVSVTEIQ